MSGYDSQANELMRRLRELWIADIDETLRKIDPGLLSGKLGTKSLPGGTMISRGGYNSEARYRTGDVVTEAGAVYLAIQGGIGHDTSDLAYWIPLGGGGGGALEALYWDSEALIWGGDGLNWGS